MISVITSLYNCERYLQGFFSYLLKTDNLNECEFIFIHNKPHGNEKRIIEQFIKEHPKINIKYIKLDFVETLYASWNRGIKSSEGKYIAIWNVDDIRMPDSLRIQAQALDENPNAKICYGDIHGMEKYGVLEGKLFYHPVYPEKKNNFLRSHFIGCFPMWKREIHNKVGYFDEQYRLVGDYEFQIRAARNFEFVKANKVLGYYSINGKNQLSSNFRLQNAERTSVEIRYGVCYKINLLYFFKAIKSYKIYKCLYNGKYQNISKYFNNYIIYILLRIPLLIRAFIRLPRNILSYLKHVAFKN
jgi:GT2 family glycosyltransferase